MRWRLGAVLGFLAGCHGAEVVSPDAGSDAGLAETGPAETGLADTGLAESGLAETGLADAAAEDGAGDADAAPLACNVPGNLVRNPSFEVVVGGAVASWPAGLVSKTGGAYDCERYVEWRPAGTSDILSQDGISTGASEAPAGTTFEVSVWAKTIDGNSDPVVLWTQGASDDYQSHFTSSIGTSWTHLTTTFTLAKPTSQLLVALRLNTETPRALAVDLVSLVRKP